MFLIAGGIHKIEEGNVGVYFRGGAILRTVTEPGFHTMVPFITQYDNIQVTVQTDKVLDIPCGTSGGVVIYFGKSGHLMPTRQN
jgi:regulator of protease activity HflC (stomatin/prohibitin superfamily)